MEERKVLDNDKIRDMPPSEIAEMEKQAAQAEREYWQNVPYDEAVSAEIHKKYTIDDEMGLHRQRYDKPEEYAAYFAYCEECKAFVKAKKQEVENDPEH